MSDSRWKLFVLRKQFTIFPLFGVQGCPPLVQCHYSRTSWGRCRPPKSQRVLDALRCIISLIWALNEFFQMKILPVLTKQSTFFTLSWCAGLSACGTMPLRPDVWGPLNAPRSQRVLDALKCILSLIWDAFFGVQSRVVGAQFFFMESELNYFFQRISGRDFFFNSIHAPPPPPPPGYLMVNALQTKSRWSWLVLQTNTITHNFTLSFPILTKCLSKHCYKRANRLQTTAVSRVWWINNRIEIILCFKDSRCRIVVVSCRWRNKFSIVTWIT